MLEGILLLQLGLRTISVSISRLIEHVPLTELKRSKRTLISVHKKKGMKCSRIWWNGVERHKKNLFRGRKVVKAFD